MSKSHLRAISPGQSEHPRELAARLLREREQSKVPQEAIVNIHVPEEVRPPSLNVDEVLEKATPDLNGKR